MNFNHIIMISIDSLRLDCITADGASEFVRKYSSDGDFKTAILDSIIKRGVLFRNCMTAAPYTTASHAAYFTGCWPRKNGVYEFFNRKICKPTIFQLARSSGFKTIFQTDFPIILGDSLGFTKGVDHYYVEDENKAFLTLQKNKSNKTLSFFHFGGVHYPYGFHKYKFAKNEYPEKVSQMENEFDIRGFEKFEDILDETYRDKRDKKLFLRYKRIVDTLYDKKKYDDLKKIYVDGISFFMKNRFDKIIRKIIKFADRENALVVIFSDHGEDWNEGSKGHSNSISDGVLRVPLIIYGNGLPKNKRVDQLIRTIDVLPTILSLSSIDNGKTVDGKLIDLFNLNNLEKNRVAFSQVWRVGDKIKVHRHQQIILEQKKMIKPLKTNLEKESVYFKDLVLHRLHRTAKGKAMENYYRNNISHLKNAEPTLAEKKKMLKLLDQYNSYYPSKKTKINKISEEIAYGLRLSGYDI